MPMSTTVQMLVTISSQRANWAKCAEVPLLKLSWYNQSLLLIVCLFTKTIISVRDEHLAGSGNRGCRGHDGLQTNYKYSIRGKNWKTPHVSLGFIKWKRPKLDVSWKDISFQTNKSYSYLNNDVFDAPHEQTNILTLFSWQPQKEAINYHSSKLLNMNGDLLLTIPWGTRGEKKTKINKPAAPLCDAAVKQRCCDLPEPSGILGIQSEISYGPRPRHWDRPICQTDMNNTMV